MAKRVMDRRALRAQSEAAERRDTGSEGKDTDKAKGDDEGDGKKKKKTAKVKEKSTVVKKKSKRPRGGQPGHPPHLKQLLPEIGRAHV